jgi:hypothetical protein
MTGIVKALVGGTLGLAGLLVAAGYAYTLDTQKSCNANGYILCGDGKCGTRTCGGKEPGQTMCAPSACYMCDGCSGTWILVGRSLPSGGARLPVQLPGVEIPPGTQIQPGSNRLRPPGSSALPAER